MGETRQSTEAGSFVVGAIEVGPERISVPPTPQEFLDLAEHIDGAYWVVPVEARGRIVYASPRHEEVFGVTPSQVHADPRCWLRTLPSEHRRVIVNAIRDGGHVRVRVPYDHPKLGARWVDVSVFPLTGEDQVLRGIAGLATDVTQIKEYEFSLQHLRRQLEEHASTDLLTRTYNRHGLAKVLWACAEEARRTGVRMGAIIMDCDNFSAINDRFGHATGDVMLAEVARRMEEVLRTGDHIGRIGGDEFLVLLPNTREAEVARVAERLRVSVTEAPLVDGDREVRITASFGYSMVPTESQTLDELIVRTKDALARSKAAGKNRVSRHQSSAPHRSSLDDYPIESLLRSLASGDALRTVGQPIRELGTESIVGVELLSRGPQGIYQSPVQFFPLCAEHNLLTAVDLQCLRKALRCFSSTANDLERHVNLFPSTLLETPIENLPELFSCSDPSKLCVEISEQQFIGDPSYLAAHVQALKKLGVRIAIDDVGFGRSSLESLIVLEPHVIKIDRSFVNGVSSDSVTRRFLERLLRVARSLETHVVAEGIATRHDLRVLRNLGILHGQGFLWDKPSSEHIVEV